MSVSDWERKEEPGLKKNGLAHQRKTKRIW